MAGSNGWIEVGERVGKSKMKTQRGGLRIHTQESPCMEEHSHLVDRWVIATAACVWTARGRRAQDVVWHGDHACPQPPFD